MTDRTIYSLYVDLFENGFEKDLRDFSAEQRAALKAAIQELWSPTLHSKREFVAMENQDGDLLHLIYYENGIQAPFPQEWMTREVVTGAPFKNEQFHKLVGDRIPLLVEGFGPHRIQVQFADV